MSSFFELFSPSLRYQREQKDLEKMLIVKTPTTGKGPVQVDLDKGKILIRRPGADDADEPADDDTSKPAPEAEDLNIER